MPSHWVKLRTSTPISGMMPNATNIRKAGNAIHVTDPLRPPVEALLVVLRGAGGASAVIAR
ncbi:hypothetical protein Afe04nite_46670 [Asanoa ferruginea]|nr:hypothetical protein Afe04nite_46670 [Asanoa ferruginea]